MIFWVKLKKVLILHSNTCIRNRVAAREFPSREIPGNFWLILIPGQRQYPGIPESYVIFWKTLFFNQRKSKSKQRLTYDQPVSWVWSFDRASQTNQTLSKCHFFRSISKYRIFLWKVKLMTLFQSHQNSKLDRFKVKFLPSVCRHFRTFQNYATCFTFHQIKISSSYIWKGIKLLWF